MLSSDASQQPDVSIHAFRGEGDSGGICTTSTRASFNPRLPGGRRPLRSTLIASMSCFNPRLPGGRRLLQQRRRCWYVDVSIHAFRGEGDITIWGGYVAADVSIHAFRGEGDVSVPALRCGAGVSIHAFRGEGDERGLTGCGGASTVSIHAFRGEGDMIVVHRIHWSRWEFQSTPSGGKATW